MVTLKFVSQLYDEEVNTYLLISVAYHLDLFKK